MNTILFLLKHGGTIVIGDNHQRRYAEIIGFGDGTAYARLSYNGLASPHEKTTAAGFARLAKWIDSESGE